MELQGILEKIIIAYLFKEWNLNAHYLVHKSLPLVLVLICIQPMSRYPVSLTSFLILSSNLYLLLSPKCKYCPQLSVLKPSFYILGMWNIRFLRLTQENSLELHEFAQQHANCRIETLPHISQPVVAPSPQ
jgi:hypothetical protein